MAENNVLSISGNSYTEDFTTGGYVPSTVTVPDVGWPNTVTISSPVDYFIKIRKVANGYIMIPPEAEWGTARSEDIHVFLELDDVLAHIAAIILRGEKK